MLKSTPESARGAYAQPAPTPGDEVLGEPLPTHHHDHTHNHGHTHSNGHGHGHTHGAIDPEIAASDRGLWAVKWSFVGLAVTAIAQAVVLSLSGSVALLADLIHNVGDALTSVPLAVAFLLTRLGASRRFAYGYGRAEDLAGLAVVGVVLISAIVTGYEAVDRLRHPAPLAHLGALAAAAVVGFVGNEGVALLRLRVGREIHSAALVADGLHARADGLVSLAVLVSAGGVGLGYPWVDPVVGLAITLVLLRVVWQSGQTVFTRLLDGVEPEVVDCLHHAIDHALTGSLAESIPQDAQITVTQVTVAQVKARWLGHRLHGAITLAVPPQLSVAAGQALVGGVRDRLRQHIPYLSEITVELVGTAGGSDTGDRHLSTPGQKHGPTV